MEGDTELVSKLNLEKYSSVLCSEDGAYQHSGGWKASWLVGISPMVFAHVESMIQDQRADG